MKKGAITSIYILGFLFTLHYTLAVFINSSLIATVLPEKMVGFVYMISSLITLVAFFGMSRFLRSKGDYKLTELFIVITGISLLLLSISKNPVVIIVSLVTSLVMVSLIYFDLDILLENFSTHENTGSVRGKYLTLSNVAWVIAPIIAGFILGNTENYPRIYLVSFLILMPALFFLRREFKTFKDPEYKNISLGTTLSAVISNKNTRGIFACTFLLNLFFSITVIYLPIFLHDHIGFDWEQLGLMFGISLLPYVFFEIPLGWLADKKIGEVEILSLGFLITGVMTIVMALTKSADFVIWTLLLFTARTGASMIEIMSETYFFKNIQATDLDIVSFFRIIRRLAWIVGPLSATFFFIFIDYRTALFILGIVMLSGIRNSASLTDTL